MMNFCPYCGNRMTSATVIHDRYNAVTVGVAPMGLGFQVGAAFHINALGAACKPPMCLERDYPLLFLGIAGIIVAALVGALGKSDQYATIIFLASISCMVISWIIPRFNPISLERHYRWARIMVCESCGTAGDHQTDITFHFSQLPKYVRTGKR